MAFNIDNYVTVNERLLLALEKFPDLRVVESEPVFVNAPDGKVFVQAKMTVYRTWDDTLPMVGFIWEEFPGKTPYTSGSEQPNSATSVLGRILGYMGFGVSKSIASRDDVQRRERPTPTPAPRPTPKVVPVVYPDGEPVLDPFTGEASTKEVYPPGDATKGQMGKIRGMGRDKGIITNKGLFDAVGSIIGRRIGALDDLSKREASQVIEAWSTPVIPDDAGEIPGPLDEEPF